MSRRVAGHRRMPWRSCALPFFVAMMLSACAEAPVADKPVIVATEPVAIPPPEPQPADVDTPATVDEPLPKGNEALVPTCLPATDSAPKPKPKPKPKLKEAPPQPQTDAVVDKTPPGGVVDADVKPLSDPVLSILGKNVQGPKGEDLGRVVDVLADASGRVRVAIIDFGGFLGVGNRRIAVDWPLLRFSPDDKDKPLILSLSREKLQAAPEYRDDSAHPQALMVPLPAASTHVEGKQ